MPNANHKKEPNMDATPLKRKTAVDDLLDDFDEIIDRAGQAMNDQEFIEAEKKFNELAATPSRARRRERA